MTRLHLSFVVLFLLPFSFLFFFFVCLFVALWCRLGVIRRRTTDDLTP